MSVSWSSSHEDTVLVAVIPVSQVVLATDGGGGVAVGRGGGFGVADAGGLVVWSGAGLFSKSPGGRDMSG